MKVEISEFGSSVLELKKTGATISVTDNADNYLGDLYVDGVRLTWRDAGAHGGKRGGKSISWEDFIDSMKNL